MVEYDWLVCGKNVIIESQPVEKTMKRACVPFSFKPFNGFSLHESHSRKDFAYIYWSRWNSNSYVSMYPAKQYGRLGWSGGFTRDKRGCE